MSEVMMSALQVQNESLTRQVKQLGPENERVRKLLTEFDRRHDRDQAEITRLKARLWSIAHAAGIEEKDDLMQAARDALSEEGARP